MRFPLMSVGNFTFEETPLNKGFIGGKIFATNKETGEEISRTYKRFHTGKTNKFDVLAQLMYELVPPQPSEENNDTNEEAIIEGISDEKD